ncbi:MAG: YbjQ family protein [Caldisericota bacterium]|nr:YbjQ family protein [Caldisericota bacterium]
MIVATMDYVPGKKVKEILGIATGNVVKTKNIGRDIMAGLKNLAGGEIGEYIELLKDSRDEAIAKMIKNAEELGADAIINVRLATSSVMQGAAELLAYGTAVKLENEK